jgi:uncharacterized protein (TIGR02145 family)
MENGISLYLKSLVTIPDEPVSAYRTALLAMPKILDPTNVDYDRFTANWQVVPGATGYILEVAFDELFLNYVSGYNEVDVGNNLQRTLTGLDRSTDYYYRVRAYNPVINSLRSNTMHVRTAEYIIYDLDGNAYAVIVIGDQEWIGSNLRTTKYSDGSAIPNITDGAAWYADRAGAYCWYANLALVLDPDDFKIVYGALYNHYVVTNIKGLVKFTRNGSDSPGWRIPFKSDFETLYNELGGASVAGGKLKEIGSRHWSFGSYENIGATNESKFTATGTGYRSGGVGNFFNFGLYGTWWSQENYYLGTFKTSAAVHYNTSSYTSGRSIRCVRDII